MQTNILWAGREYHSLENCLINTVDTGSEIESVIIGNYAGRIFKVEYQIKTNQNGETILLELKSQYDNQRQHLILKGDGKGNWIENGRYAEQFKGCIDIDISLTPFTNTLAINRLKLSPNEWRQISVIYLDILKHRLSTAHQKYTRLSEKEHRFENVPNDFEAIIEVDESGLVVDYPGLFGRVAVLKTNYL